MIRRSLEHLRCCIHWITLPAAVWCLGTLHFLVFKENPLPTVVTAFCFLLLWLSGWIIKRGTIVLVIAELGITICYCAVTPQCRFAQTVWQQPWERRPSAEILNDGSVLIRNVRDFRYRTADDCIVRYRDVKVDPDDLQSLDLAISHWDGLEAVAHTMLAFNFKNQKTLVLSMETRLPAGSAQSAVRGLFKQYEIIPVIGTPEDLFDLRIHLRGEDFYRYRINASPEQTEKIFCNVLESLAGEPEFYNTLSHNCSTSLSLMLEVLEKDPIKDIRLLINGFSDRMLYDFGYLTHNRGESFFSLKNRSYISGKSRGIPSD